MSCRVCGVLGHLTPVHRCAGLVRCLVCAVSWATWLLLIGVLFRSVLLRCVCGVFGHLAHVHRCARLVCRVTCAVSWASLLLNTGVLFRCLVSLVRCPWAPGFCSPVCLPGALSCVYGVLGHLAPDHWSARSLCCVPCAASWATWLLFTGVLAPCVVLYVRCPGPLGSCSPGCSLGVLCCVACAVFWATWLLFTGVPARCVASRVRCPATPRHGTTRTPPGPPPPAIPTTPPHPPTPTAPFNAGDPSQGEWWQRWTQTQLWELRKWAPAERSLEELVHRPRKGVGGELPPQGGGGLDATGRMGSHADRCPPPQESPSPHPSRAPGPPVCAQGPAGDPPGDAERRQVPVGHHPKPNPAYTHLLATPQASTHRHQQHREHPAATRATEQETPDSPASGATNEPRYPGSHRRRTPHRTPSRRNQAKRTPMHANAHANRHHYAQRPSKLPTPPQQFTLGWSPFTIRTRAAPCNL